MLNFKRTNAQNDTFQMLVKELDRFLVVTDGDDHAFYNQFNQLDDIKFAIIIYKDDEPIGCGAIKQYDENRYEIKRMYVEESNRGNGFAGILLAELENWAKDLGAKICILETGIRQTSAIRLYQKCSYKKIPNYGQYQGIVDSVCFEKKLS